LQKSFASHKKAKFWDPENDKSPREVFKNSNDSYSFVCPCGHKFRATLNNISNGKFCPYCSDPPKLLCSSVNCQECFHKSFASHKKAKFWDPENNKTPREVFKNSGEKFSFLCDCGHKFTSVIASISMGRWCPYCCIPRQKLCSDLTCENCMKNSMATHPCSQFWLDNNDKSPREVFPYSKYKINFRCEEGHDFSLSVASVTVGNWCPLCFRKGERKLYEALKNETYSIVREKKFEWCKNEDTGYYFRFDFKIQNGYKVLIELDGEQHFKQVRNWKSPQETMEIDLHKMNLANENGYAIIRITWEMVFYNRSNWKAKLIDAIETIEPSSRLYICTNGEYDIYQTEE